MHTIQLGMMLTPTMARDKGLMLIVSPDLPLDPFHTYGITSGGSIHYCTTLSHTVVCITSMVKVAEYCHRLGIGKR